MSKRCDQVIVQVVVREYDGQGRPVGEQVSQPVNVFRAASPDFWTHVDTLIKQQPPKPGKRK